MSARSWDEQLQSLPGVSRVIALDLPGHGESDPEGVRVAAEDTKRN